MRQRRGRCPNRRRGSTSSGKSSTPGGVAAEVEAGESSCAMSARAPGEASDASDVSSPPLPLSGVRSAAVPAASSLSAEERHDAAEGVDSGDDDAGEAAWRGVSEGGVSVLREMMMSWSTARDKGSNTVSASSRHLSRVHVRMRLQAHLPKCSTRPIGDKLDARNKMEGGSWRRDASSRHVAARQASRRQGRGAGKR